ncbi:MAG: hypothetical protein A2144_02080 [Chloroflexi bacterium RBG_16_50_9]|nr:MAG: hypothetical protein A2144_02080 [Chloroflexi bacterium RBG_16_50_9]
MKFSVIIPTLNEAAVIHQRIAHVRSLSPGAEIIVADGGSTDDTAAIARGQGIPVVSSEPGRGIQCNAGAVFACGDILVFLHADTELPSDAFTQLEEYFTKGKVLIGTFRLSFDVNHWSLRLCRWICDFDLAFTRFGDQCLVVRKSFFISAGGFPDWGLFEDLAFINRARRKTPIYRFPGRVRTSARRFLRRGILRQQFLNIWYIAQYFLGVSPDKLAREYERAAKKRNGVGLAVFARTPLVGRVKTRLAKSLGAEKATELYRLCAEHVFHECERLSSRAQLYVFFDGADKIEQGRSWAGPRFDSLVQSGGNLGQRLEHAVQTMFHRGTQRVVILASDVPDVSQGIIKDAIRALDKYDIVLGPCYDGGYYLIGMKSQHPELFASISWSTAHVYRETLAASRKSGLKVYELPRLIDIDTEEDLRLWLVQVPGWFHPAIQNFARDLGL